MRLRGARIARKSTRMKSTFCMQAYQLVFLLGSFIVLLCGCSAQNVPATATFAPTATRQSPPVIPHPIANFSDCTACHHPRSRVPIPASHAQYKPDSCLDCHVSVITSTQTTMPTPPPASHSFEGREQCSLCHAAGRLELPPDHREYADQKCAECHAELP